MKKKLLITEKQFEAIKKFIVESGPLSTIVKEIVEDLNANYTPMDNYVQEGGEYHPVKMFKVNVSEELITAEALCDTMTYKHKMSEEFIQQVIRDWVDGKISEDYQLSKIVPLK